MTEPILSAVTTNEPAASAPTIQKPKRNFVPSWVRRFKDYIVPYDPHPLYWLERKRVKNAATPAKFQRWARRRVLWVWFFLTLGWFINLGVAWWTEQQTNFSYSSSFGVVFPTIVFGFAMLAFIVFDLSAVFTAFGVVSDDVTLNRRELLEMAVDRKDMVRVKHRIGYLRNIGTLLLWLSVRAWLLFIGLFYVLFAGFFWRYEFSTFFDVIGGIMDYPLTSFLSGIGLVLVALFYFFEPVLRMRAYSAMGAAVNARVSSIALGIPVGAFIIFLIFVAQMIILFAYWYLVAWIGNAIVWEIFQELNLSWQTEEVIGIELLLIAGAIFLVVVFVFYHVMTQLAYSQLRRRYSPR